MSSLNVAAKKLVVSNTADNTAEIEQDIAALNERYYTDSIYVKGALLTLLSVSFIHCTIVVHSELYIVACKRCTCYSRVCSK